MSPLEALEAACDPNKTKALLIGEFETDNSFDGPSIIVDWTAVKKIQRAILEQARLNMGWKCGGCGSASHILEILDGGHRSCCPERRLVPPTEWCDTPPPAPE